MTQPDSQGQSTLRRRAEDRLLSGAPSREGRQDLGPLQRIIHELQVHQVELELQNEELRIARAEEDKLRERYANFYDFSPIGFLSLDPQGLILQANLTCASLLGEERVRLVGRHFLDFIDWDQRPPFHAYLKQLQEEGGHGSGEVTLKAGASAPRTLHLEGTWTADRQEFRVVLVDVTDQKMAMEERRVLEHELLQSQKLESLGSLAGGMAHDMNNVLGAILGLASTLHLSAEPGSPGDRSLNTIMKACLRGRGVVRSLLYFARKELGEERPLELNALVTDMVQLLGSTTLQRVKLETVLQPGLPPLLGDAGSVHNALMNLCINAVDAMPGGGTLRLETRLLDDGSQDLSVQDTGEGMSEVILAKAMDPFFTTKPFGKGTGLGLSMAYGTMKAHEGSLELHSQVGVGTEAILRFPPARTLVGVTPQPVLPEPPISGVGSLDVLLVDDDELVRASLTAMLEVLGHRVTPASGGHQALQILATRAAVDLVVLDMNMPDMSGAQALPRILSLRPDVAVLLDTGHGMEEAQPLMVGRPNLRSLMKPFSLSELRAKVEELASTRGGKT